MKIYYMGNEIRSTRKKYPKAIKHGKYSKTRFQLFMQKIRKTVAKVLHITKLVLYGLAGASTVIAVGMIIYSLGGRFHPHIVEAAPVIVEVSVPVERDFALLRKICKAESGGEQFDKKGKVIVGKIDPRDKGICQINEYYNGAKARELGYDIYTKEGNIKMAEWLFLNFGSSPWDASKDGPNGWGNKVYR